MECLKFLTAFLVGICAVVVQVSADDPPPNLCDPNPCMNGGSYTCQCTGSFSGVNCEIDLCDPNPCENGGTCTGTGYGGYTCECKDSYSGANCETDLCDPNPCENGGTCTGSGDGGYICECKDSYSGVNCEIDVCDPNPCENGGTCTGSGDGGYTCQCKDSYSGVNCELGPCNPTPCMNGGSCTDSGDGGYTCECQDSYSGVNCEIDLCDPNPCENGGTCTGSGDGGYTCECKDSYSGDNCEIDLCDPNPCENGGTCTGSGDGGYTCECKDSYSGVNCELGSTCCDETNDILWVDYADGQEWPETAVKGCKRKGCDNLYVGRAKANGEGNYIPGKITSDKVCHVAAGENEFNENTYQVLTEPNGKKVTWVRADGNGAPDCSVVCDPSVPNVYFGRRKPKRVKYGIGQVSNDILTTTNNGALINSTTADGFEYLVCTAPTP